MSLNPRLQELVDRFSVRYEIVRHPETVTIKEAARRTHVAGCHVAKAVVVRDQAGTDLMVVLPAELQLDIVRVEHLTGRRGVRLADEKELARLFPDCELGAMPPIGHLYDIATYVDRCLVEDQNEIWFQGGNHHELVRMSVPDFEKIAAPYFCPACMHEEVVGVAS